MADKTVIIRLDVQEAGAISSINALNNSLSGLDKTSEEYAEVLRKIQVEETRLSKIQASRVSSQNNVSKAQASVTKSLNSQTDATGSATAATMELSRIVSDAPYGIRGMANNISQLVSQLGTASIKAGGLGAALKLMIGTLKGPLGVVFLITAAVSALDYFKGAQTKAKDATKEHNDELERQAGLMQNLQAIQDLLSSSVSSVSLDFMDAFKAGVDSLTDKDLLRVLERDIKGITSAFNNLPKEEQNIEGIEILVRKRRELIEEQITEKKIKEELIELEKKYFIYRNLSNNATGKALKEDIESKQRELLATQKSIIDIEDLFKNEKGKENKDKIKLIEFEDFNETAENYRSELGKLNEQLELIDAKSEVEKLQIKKKYHLARLDAQHIESTQKYEQTAIEYRAELKLYLDQQVSLGLMSKETAAKRLEIFDKNTNVQIEQSQKSFNTLRDIQKAFYDNQILEASTAGLKLAGNGNTRATQENIDLLAHLKRKADAYASYAESVKEVLSSVSDFIDSEFQRELIIEQNKTNSANQALNDRLLNENLSKDQRASIQNQIAQNDEKLRVKQEKIARKQFAVEKAFKIGMAIADTASSALRAFSSQINPLDPTSLARAVVAASAATAFGLAQVAMIARTKFQSSAPASPANASLGGGSGGDSGRAEPSFNIVGRSNENLILKAIQSQFDQPLKAYVVARDVTNQQQLDGIISNTSSI